VRSLLEYASRDGNYACAVPVDPEGALEPQCVTMLQEMGRWMKINGEGIYGSKAWKVWGEGEAGIEKSRVHQGTLNKESAGKTFSTRDFRFTVGKDGSLYAWCLAVPQAGEVLEIKALGSDARLLDRPIKSVKSLGGGEVSHKQETGALKIACPENAMPLAHAVGFRIELN
jgi:alpha-L-fucosidase